MIEFIKNKTSLLTCILFLVAGGIISALLKYEMTYDFLMYHYYNGFAFVNARHGIDLAAASLMTYYNPLLDALTYLLIRFCGNNLDLYYFIAGLPFGLLMFIFLKICLLFFDPTDLKGKIQITTAILIAATGFHVWSQIGTTSHDISSNVFILASFYFLVRKDKNFFIAGFLLGTAAALKLACAIYCISSGLSLILMYKKLPSPFKNISVFALGGFLGFILFNGFWMYFLWENYQNPFFPFWNKLFKSPYYPLINYADKLASDKMSLFDFIFLPFYLINHSGLSEIIINTDVMDFRLSFLFTIMVCSVFFFLKTKKTFSPEMKTLCILMAVSYIIWLFLSANTRFAIPIEMFTAIVIVSCFSLVKYPQKMIPEGIYWSVVILLLFLFCSVPHYSNDWGRRTETEFLKEKIMLPDNTLIMEYGAFGPALAAQLIEKNPTAKAIGFRVAIQNHWKQWDISGYGKMAEIKNEMIKEHQNKVALITESPFAQFIPSLPGEKSSIIKDWSCEELLANKSFSKFNAIFKLCFPPEIKDKIIIEK